MTLEELLSEIMGVLSKDPRTIEQRVIKTGEEYGELCEAVCSATKAPGCEYKGKTIDDIVEEAWDTVICAVSVAIQAKPEMAHYDHARIIRDKLIKWETNLEKRG